MKQGPWNGTTPPDQSLPLYYKPPNCANRDPWRSTVNTAAQLLQANLDLLARGESCGVWANLADDVTLIPPLRIESGAVVGPGCRLGPGVYLEEGAVVGADAVLREALVLRGGHVPPAAQIRRRIVGP